MHRPWSPLRAFGAAFVAILFALPLVFMISGSLRPPGLPPPSAPQLVPDPLGVGSYGRAFDLVDLGRYTVNSLIVVALVVPLTVVVASWAGFAIARLGGRSAALLVAVSIAALMVPTTALLVPRFTLYRLLGVTDTWVPLIAPALLGTSPLFVLLYAVAFRRLPRDLYDMRAAFCAATGEHETHTGSARRARLVSPTGPGRVQQQHQRAATQNGAQASTGRLHWESPLTDSGPLASIGT